MKVGTNELELQGDEVQLNIRKNSLMIMEIRHSFIFKEEYNDFL